MMLLGSVVYDCFNLDSCASTVASGNARVRVVLRFRESENRINRLQKPAVLWCQLTFA